MSSTSDINLITLQVVDENNDKWHSTDGSYFPVNMQGNPEGYAQALHDAMPSVNTLRLFFNENCFDANGNLHEQYERFINAATDLGFKFVFTYGSGETRSAVGTGDGKNSLLPDPGEGQAQPTNQEIHDALEDNYTNLEEAWTKMSDWLANNPEVKTATHGLEVVNEPMAYNNGNDGSDLGRDDFVQLYVDHVTRISNLLQLDNPDQKILVGAWHASGIIDRLADTNWDGKSALDHVREAVGEALEWSIHIYRNSSTEAGSDTPTDPDAFRAYLDDYFEDIIQDDILITELTFSDQVNNIDGGLGENHAQAMTLDWFHENGIGVGVFVSDNPDNSPFGYNYNGYTVNPNPFHMAHSMNGMSLGEEPVEHQAGELVDFSIVGLGPQGGTRWGYQNRFGFGYGGDDTLDGTIGDDTLDSGDADQFTDFFYGGSGNDVIIGGAPNGFLFGQSGDDTLYGGERDNYLYGGDGADYIVGGVNYDQMAGGLGSDTFATSGSGNDVIVDFALSDDKIDLDGSLTSWVEIASVISTLDADNDGSADDVVISIDANSSLTVLNVTGNQLNHTHFIGVDQPAIPDGKVDGTDGDDYILTEYTDGQGEAVSDGADVIYGYDGNDTLRGFKGDDTIYGGNGDDYIVGDKQNNSLYGEAGNDTIHTGAHASIVEGGSGNDHIFAKMSTGGGHVLSGGSGADIFEFVYASSNKIDDALITDFNVLEDSLIIMGETVDLVNPQAGFVVSETADGLHVAYGDDDYVLLMA